MSEANFFLAVNHQLTSNPALFHKKPLALYRIFLLLHPASEEEVNKLKRWHRDMESRIYFKINVADEEKIATFAARFGRTGSQLNLVY